MRGVLRGSVGAGKWGHVHAPPGQSAEPGAIAWLLQSLEVESAEEGGPEGAQVQVSGMLMYLTHIADYLPVRVMKASLEGPAAAEL